MTGAFVFAFAAGMVATVNPCGFAMVPAYLSMFLTDGDQPAERSGLVAGLRIGLWVTAGFVATFSLVGAVVRLVTFNIIDFVPWAALVIGAALTILGVTVLTGRHLKIRTAGLRFAKDRSPRSMVLFGVAYGVASISCTLPIFLSVTTQAFTASSPATGSLIFAGYGLGMGVVLMAVAAAVATSRDAVVRHMRKLTPYVERIGGWLLVASGLFIVYYWVTSLTVPVMSPGGWYEPVLFVDRISAWFTRQIGENTIMWLAGLVATVAVVAAFEVRRTSRSKSINQVTIDG